MTRPSTPPIKTVFCSAVVLAIALNASAGFGGQGESRRRREDSITGRVLDGAGQPVPNASVYVRKVGAYGAGGTLGADSEGRFQADGLARGPYTVIASVPGYVSEQQAVETQYYRPGDTVTLRMVKGAVISGAVTNSVGDPVIAARVSAIRVKDAEGRSVPAGGPGGNRQTDDRGVYRLYGLQAGTYLVVVNAASTSSYPLTGYDGDAPTYYPSTTRDAASEVTVRNGDEITGIDIRYRGERGHIVSGTISGSLGTDNRNPGIVVVTLSNAASGAAESSAFISLRNNERGFALYGVPDGEYDVQAQIDAIGENAAASAPRRVAVRGSDVTGLELSLARLGSIAGRVVLETLSESERKPDCKDKRTSRVDETVLVSRRDVSASVQAPTGLLSPRDGAPDEKGEFKIYGLVAGPYRIQARLPSENWFIRSMTLPGSSASRPRVDAAAKGLSIAAGQRVADLTVLVVEGAAAIRGKVVAGAGKGLPARLRVHLVPAEADAADAVVRYYEAAVEPDNSFSCSNIAPGRYFILARAELEEAAFERTPRPAAWDAKTRAGLRAEALAANNVVEFQMCQRVSDFALRYVAPAATKR